MEISTSLQLYYFNVTNKRVKWYISLVFTEFICYAVSLQCTTSKKKGE